MSVSKHFPLSTTGPNSNIRLFNHLHAEVEKVFEQVHASWPELADNQSEQSDFEERASFNIVDTGKAIDIACDLSGYDSEDIRVSANENCLIIEASSHESAERNFYLGDPSMANIRRVIPLGFVIDSKSLKSNCSNGILAVHVDKPANSSRSARNTIDA